VNPKARLTQKRHHLRVQGDWSAYVFRLTGGGLRGKGFQATVIDISAGGMAIIADEAIFRPARVEINLKFLGLELVARGTTVRVDNRGGRVIVAVRFDDLDIETEIRLGKAILREAHDRRQGATPVRPSDDTWWHRPASDATG
jgi:PilZ domain